MLLRAARGIGRGLVADTTRAAYVRRLEHSNLLLVALDTKREWYRYHYLFGQLQAERIGPR
jgi:ATP/maltotriose-dependent transcriptional regulator MalT